MASYPVDPDLVPQPLRLTRQLARRGHAVKPKVHVPGGRETEFGTLKQNTEGAVHLFCPESLHKERNEDFKGASVHLDSDTWV